MQNYSTGFSIGPDPALPELQRVRRDLTIRQDQFQRVRRATAAIKRTEMAARQWLDQNGTAEAWQEHIGDPIQRRIEAVTSVDLR